MDRIINLYDDESEFIVETDAPSEEIEKALEYKNQMLENDDPAFRSDYEEMQDYLHSKGYTFEEIGYTYELEKYYW